MLDITARLLVAYGLMGVMFLAAVALVWRSLYNAPQRRNGRQRKRELERYRLRAEAAAEPVSDHP